MKTKFIYLFAAAFISMSSMAQIDRTKMPEPGPAPAINLGKPQTFNLPNGLKVMVVEDKKLPRVSINLSVDNGLIAEGDRAGIKSLMGELVGNGSTKTPKDAFNEEIDFMGASIGFRSNGASAYALSKYFDRVLEMMTEGLLHPNFTQEELDTERRKAIESLKENEKSAGAIANRVSNVLTFGRKHPFGEFTTEETLNNITLADIRSYYNKYFVPENAYLIIIGDVDFNHVKKQVEERFQMWKKAKAPKVDFSDPKPVQYTQINLIDVPNAVQSEVSFVNPARLSMADKDYFAVLIANEILGGSFDSYLNLTLREKKAWTYGARSGIRGSKHITSFRAGAGLKMVATDSAVVEILTQIKRIRDEKVTDEDLQNAKAAYVGNFVRQFAKPEAISSYALNIETQKLPKDYYENYLKNINAVTKEDVMRVARKYFMTDNARIVIASKASEVGPKLEALNIPIFYFDKYGNPTEKPEVKKVSADVTPTSVIENYFKAIGGKDKAAAVQTIAYKGTANLPGAPAPATYINKVDKDGKLMVEILMGPMSLMKQVINKDKGYMVQQGQKMDLEGETLEEMKPFATTFPEFAMLSKEGLSIKGIEDFEGKEVYVLVNGKSSSLYDVKTGLKLADVAETPQGPNATAYKDYREVNGVLLPFTTVLNIGIPLEINMEEVLINSGVTAEDFN